jgi:hypothetical protein
LKKQKCVSKSLTEAELVALLHNVGLVELFQELLSFMINAKMLDPIVYQDNMLVIMSVTKGGDVTWTKQMRTRMKLVLEAVK